jgi:dCTP deaminase
MILSNVEIVRALKEGLFRIDGLDNSIDPTQSPFNTSAIDLRLGASISIPYPKSPISATLDLSKKGIPKFLQENSKDHLISDEQPFKLSPNKFVLANTFETVEFPLPKDASSLTYAARVEGKSSLARCGLLVHFTAPTIHAGFTGKITLEMINLGPFDILLSPKMSICQLILEEVKGSPLDAPNQFRGQNQPSGAQ